MKYIETTYLENLAAYNRRLAKKRVQCLNEALYFVSSSVLADSFVLRNPLLRQAPNRYVQGNYSLCKNIKAPSPHKFSTFVS